MFRLAFDFLFNSKLFLPTYRVRDFSRITQLVKVRNTKFIIFDKDDTLTELKQFQIRDQAILDTLEELKSMKVQLKILSNSIKPEDPGEMEGMQILRMGKKKPFNQKEVNKLIKNYKPEQVIIIGDRLMTDIYLANKLNILSILVPAVQKSSIKKHGIAVTVLRRIQNMFLKIKAKD